MIVNELHTGNRIKNMLANGKDQNAQRTEKALKPKDYSAIINAMIDTAWIIGLDGEIIDMNESAISLLGYTREELRDIGLSGIDNSLSEEQILELVGTMPRDKKQIFETVHKTKDGKNIPVEICSSLLKIGDNEVILSIARDITERKWADKEIQRQLEEKETLLRAIHHRIKNSIASVESLLSIQSRTIKNEEARSIIQDAIGRVSCVRILYETLLTAQNYSELSLKTFFMNILGKIVELQSGLHQVALVTEMDDFQISQRFLFPLGVIFEELLTNAYKYAFEDEADAEISIVLKKNLKGMILTISDNGKGLPSDFSLDNPPGFGLRIVKMLCNEIDADFSLEPGHGTRIKICIPKIA